MLKRYWRTTCSGLALAAALTLSACEQEPVELQPDGPRPTETTESVEPTPDPLPEPKAKYGDEPVTLAFAGDVHFEGHLRKLLANKDSLKPLNRVLGSADYAMVNLESAITTRGVPDPKNREEQGNRYHFRTDERALTVLKRGGVDIVTVANNHGADYGLQGFEDTLAAKDSNELPMVGLGRDNVEAFSAHTVELKNTTFAFFGADASFLESDMTTWEAGFKRAGLAYARRGGLVRLESVVERAAEAGQVPVVYLHWGEEGSRCVTAQQENIAKRLSDAGAAIIVGSHAHTPQASGWLKHGESAVGESALSTYVNYGLGNFVWYHGNVADSGVLRLTVQDGRVSKQAWTPMEIPRYGGLPTPRTGQDKASALRRWAQLRSCGSTVSGERQYELPPFHAEVNTIDDALAKRMASSYEPSCPVPLEALNHMRVSYYGFDNRAHTGEIVVARNQVGPVMDIFAQLYEARFPIKSMRLVSDFGGSDARSMAANNTSGFNCRRVAGTNRWSNHAYGNAIDINPVQNPYVRGVVDPPAGRAHAYIDRSANASVPKGAIKANDVAVRAFRSEGWAWGNTFQDYQHFSANGG